jgi:hypothetical protein
MTWKLLQTEKSMLNQGSKNNFTIVNVAKGHKTNKIELAKFLAKHGLNATKINVTASYQKSKTKGKAKNKIVQFRPRKWCITLKTGQLISEETINQINAINTTK